MTVTTTRAGEEADASVTDLLRSAASTASGSVPVRDRPPGGSAAVDGADPWEVLDELVSTVVQVDAFLHAVTAWRTELLDRARSFGERVHTVRFGESAPGMARRSMVAELATALRVPERTMGELVDEAQALVEHFPAALAAMRTGAVSYRHAEVLMDHTRDLDGPGRARAEAALVELASRQTVSRFRASARRWRELHHPRELAERHRAAAEQRGVWVDPSLDGMACLSALLPASQAHAIHDGVSGIAATLQGPDESRTLAQLRADVLSALLLDPAAGPLARAVAQGPAMGSAGSDGAPGSATATTSGLDPTLVCRLPSARTTGIPASTTPAPASVARAPASTLRTGPARRAGRSAGVSSLPPWVTTRGIRPQVAVTVPFLTLLGRSDGPGHLAGFGPIDAETARELAGRATGWTRILTDPVTDEVLDVGRTRYRVPEPLRRYVQVRDQTCRLPGCARSAARCDLDHTVAWEDGGRTAEGNLAHLCRAHHRLKHLAGWEVEQRPGGVLRWTSPLGRRHVTEPALAVHDRGAPDEPPAAVANSGHAAALVGAVVNRSGRGGSG